MLICFESAIGRLKVSGLSHERSVVSPKGYCVRMRLVSYRMVIPNAMFSHLLDRDIRSSMFLD